MSEAAHEAEQAFADKLAGIDRGAEPADEAPAVEEPVEAPSEPEETPAEAPAEELILGKYKTQEEANKALEEAQRHIGEQNLQLGELRQWREQVEPLLQQIQTPQQAPIDQQTVEWIDEQAMTNPVQAAEWARRNQPMLYDRVIGTWADHDPIGAMRYEQALAMQATEKRIREEYDQRLKPLADSTADGQLKDLLFSVVEEDPVYLQLSGDIPDVAKKFPVVAAQLRDPDPTVRQQTIRALFQLAKAERGATLDAAAQTAAATESEDAKRARAEAAVASAVTIPGREPPPSDGQAVFKAAFQEEATRQGAMRPA